MCWWRWATRLGLQQSGFNWQEFMPVGKVVSRWTAMFARVDEGTSSRVDVPVCGDANEVLRSLAASGTLGDACRSGSSSAASVRAAIPLVEHGKQYRRGIYFPIRIFHRGALEMCKRQKTMMVIPCSSGSAFTVDDADVLSRSAGRLCFNRWRVWPQWAMGLGGVDRRGRWRQNGRRTLAGRGRWRVYPESPRARYGARAQKLNLKDFSSSTIMDMRRSE